MRLSDIMTVMGLFFFFLMTTLHIPTYPGLGRASVGFSFPASCSFSLVVRWLSVHIFLTRHVSILFNLIFSPFAGALARI